MALEEILDLLPYSPPFLFVDGLSEITENSSKGSYRFPEDAFFFSGHFKDYPVTPGVILTECMAQIGVVCLGILLLNKEGLENCQISLTNTSIDFFLPVFPGERVEVASEKVFFRFNKIKCKVKMKNEQGKLVCRGEISGMVKIK